MYAFAVWPLQSIRAAWRFWLILSARLRKILLSSKCLKSAWNVLERFSVGSGRIDSINFIWWEIRPLFCRDFWWSQSWSNYWHQSTRTSSLWWSLTPYLAYVLANHSFRAFFPIFIWTMYFTISCIFKNQGFDIIKYFSFWKYLIERRLVKVENGRYLFLVVPVTLQRFFD